MDERRYQELSKSFDDFYRAQAAQQAQEAAQRLAPDVRIHYSSRQSMVVNPFLQSVITGSFGGAVLLTATWLVAGQIGDPAPLRTALTWAGVGAPFLTFCAWLTFTADIRKLIWSLERISGRDIDQDGQTGEPAYEPESFRVVLDNKSENQTQYVDLPIGISKMIQLARGLVAGASFSEGQWTGQGAPFSRAEFRLLRDEMLRRSWLEWRNPEAPGQGLQLTRPGWAVIKYFASMGDSPTPGGDPA